MPLEWDKDELERALRSYSPRGYPVEVPVVGNGKIEEQLLGTTGAMYRVKLERPISFDNYVKRLGRRDVDTPLTRENLESMWSGRTLPFTDEFIESGPTIRDIEFMKIRDTGCMGPDETVVCMVSPWDLTRIRRLKRGMLVEYAEYAGGGEWQGTGGKRVWAGRIVGLRDEGRTALLELFEPVTYYRTPDMIVNDEIKPGFYSDSSWAFGYGLMEAMEMAGKTDDLPPGKWTEDKKEYLLEEPYPIARVQEFCAEHFPDARDRIGFFHALTMFIVPIEVSGSGQWHPLRQDRMDDYMASIRVNYDF